MRHLVRGQSGRFRNLKQRDVVRHEALALANALIGSNDALTVVETREVWEQDAPPEPDGGAGTGPIEEEPGVPAVGLGETGCEPPAATDRGRHRAGGRVTGWSRGWDQEYRRVGGLPDLPVSAGRGT